MRIKRLHDRVLFALVAEGGNFPAVAQCDGLL